MAKLLILVRRCEVNARHSKLPRTVVYRELSIRRMSADLPAEGTSSSARRTACPAAIPAASSVTAPKRWGIFARVVSGAGIETQHLGLLLERGELRP